MTSGSKTTPAHARRAREGRTPKKAIELNLQYQHAQGLAADAIPLSRDHEHDHAARAPPKRIIDKKEALSRVGGLSYAKVWGMMIEGTFPRSFLVAGRIFWLESEIENWIDQDPRQRLKGEVA
jgi:predicted DNA-binding transcriptional regulator AlpA